MSVNSKTVASLKGQLSKFSGIISKGFKKPEQRLIKEMLYGIQASKDVKLSNISRTLKEDQPLIKTEDRLSRNLDDEDFTDGLAYSFYLPCRYPSKEYIREDPTNLTLPPLPSIKDGGKEAFPSCPWDEDLLYNPKPGLKGLPEVAVPRILPLWYLPPLTHPHPGH